MVQSPDKSFGSVLTTGFGVMSGFNALTSSSSDSEMGAAGDFFPKILESNVAIFQFSLQRRTLRVTDADANFLPRRYGRGCVNVNFVVAWCPAEIVLFHEDVLARSYKLHSLVRSDSIDQFQTAPVSLLNQVFRMTFKTGGRSSLPRRILEDESPVELNLFNQRQR